MYNSILNRQRQTIVLDRCLDNSPDDLIPITSSIHFRLAYNEE
ncbi:9247_t:CDS:2 [Funneliformis caledonium]|uniref:9247_t:CDS:1 n=1 Tax=Funneliformis caledonium TaxID=1117310 RepID=A0A9N9BXJ1_9GLOM|nr:9247_t:CDS:2 [Funneliformis caledonium]